MPKNEIGFQKLNMFQQLRKKAYLFNLNEEKAKKYVDLPEYMKKDMDISLEVVSSIPSMINQIPSNNVLSILSKDPQLVQEIDDINKKIELLNERPELVRYLDDSDIHRCVFEKNEVKLNEEVIKSMPEDVQFSLFSYSIQQKVSYDERTVSIETFPENIVLRYAIDEYKKSKVSEKEGTEKSDIYKSRLLSKDLSKFSHELQMKLLLLDNEYSNVISSDVINTYVNGNPLLTELLPIELIVQKIEDRDIDFISKLSTDFIDGLSRGNEKCREAYKIACEVNRYLVNTHDVIVNAKDIDEAKKLYFQQDLASDNSIVAQHDAIAEIDNDELCIEMLKLNPELLRTTNMNKIRFSTVREALKDISEKFEDDRLDKYLDENLNYEKLQCLDKLIEVGGVNIRFISPEDIEKYVENPSKEILEGILGKYGHEFGQIFGFDHLKEDFLNVDSNKDTKKKMDLIEKMCGDNKKLIQHVNKNLDKLDVLVKFITNDDIMQIVSTEASMGQDEQLLNKIMEYVENPDNKMLAEIVGQVYGEKSAEIITDRPRVDMSMIPNMYIFHPDIIEEFSIGATHSILSYDMPFTSAQFSELARHPEKMKEYRKFSELTKEMFGDTALDLENKMSVFEQAREVIGQIEASEFSKEQGKNFMFAMNDLISFGRNGVVEFPADVDLLESYISDRNAIFDEAIGKTTDTRVLKECISRKFFGMQYQKNGNDKSRGMTNSVENACKFYNIKDFINHDKTISSDEFSQEDLDALEVMDIILSCKDNEALKGIASSFSKNGMFMNPIKYRELLEKVPKQYTNDLVNNLINPGKAEEMIEQGMPGISIREKDGVKIITLAGIDFMAYITNIGMDNSGLTRDTLGLGSFEKWTELENGISTFSGCIINQNETRSTIGKGAYGLGICSVHPEQIVAMSNTDAMTSHDRRQLEVTSELAVSPINYSYSDDLMSKTTERIDSGKDPSHIYNEAASLRREQNLSEIKPGTYGGKTMPGYVYANGKGVGDEAVRLAKEFGLEYIIEYDDEASLEYRQQHSLTREEKAPEIKKQREESAFIRNVREISKMRGESYER